MFSSKGSFTLSELLGIFPSQGRRKAPHTCLRSASLPVPPGKDGEQMCVYFSHVSSCSVPSTFFLTIPN